MTTCGQNNAQPLLGYVFFGLAAALAATLFTFMGNSHEPELYGPSVLSWLIQQWQNPNGQSQHGWLIPLVSIFVVYRERRKLAAASRAIDNRAIVIVVLALVLYWAGYRSQQPRLGVICLIVLFWAIPFYLYGKAVARVLLFPVAYLLFAMPMGFLAAFTFPLRLFACKTAVFILNGLYITAFRQGTTIYFQKAEGLHLDIADPCSGLQSVIALTALTAAYAYLAQKGRVRKWILFLSSLPLAVAANIVRIITIALVAVSLGTQSAMKFYHDYSGFFVFAVATILMTGISSVLNKLKRNGHAEKS